MTSLRGCIVTLVALVWFFSTVPFKVSSQVACLKGGKLALAALRCFFSIACLSHGNNDIDSVFTQTISNDILIHRYWFACVVSSVLFVTDWDKSELQTGKNESEINRWKRHQNSERLRGFPVECQWDNRFVSAPQRKMHAGLNTHFHH